MRIIFMTKHVSDEMQLMMIDGMLMAVISPMRRPFGRMCRRRRCTSGFLKWLSITATTAPTH